MCHLTTSETKCNLYFIAFFQEFSRIVQLGIMSAKDAYKLAKEAELDLVKIAPTAKPPVCKIIDYGKYRYELARKEKEAKKKQTIHLLIIGNPI